MQALMYLERELSSTFSQIASCYDDADVSKDSAKLISIPTDKVLVRPAYSITPTPLSLMMARGQS